MARKKIALTEEQLETLKVHARNGLTLNQCAAILGIARSTLGEIIKRQPEVGILYEQARMLGLSEVVESLFEQARGGNVTACIYITKTQLGWREAGQDESTAIAAQVHILLPDNGRGGVSPQSDND